VVSALVLYAVFFSSPSFDNGVTQYFSYTFSDFEKSDGASLPLFFSFKSDFFLLTPGPLYHFSADSVSCSTEFVLEVPYSVTRLPRVLPGIRSTVPRYQPGSPSFRVSRSLLWSSRLRNLGSVELRRRPSFALDLVPEHHVGLASSS